MFVEIISDDEFGVINPHQIIRIEAKSRNSNKCILHLASGNKVRMSIPVDKMRGSWEAALREWYMKEELYRRGVDNG